MADTGGATGPNEADEGRALRDRQCPGPSRPPGSPDRGCRAAPRAATRGRGGAPRAGGGRVPKGGGLVIES